MATKVIHIRNKTGSINEVYIGRGGPFGNPVMLGKQCPVCGEIHHKKGSTLDCYKIYLHDRMAADVYFAKEIQRMKGKTLVCFCKPAACHGDVLVEYLEGL